MDLLLHAEISYITKEQIANLLHKADGKVAILAAELQSMELSNDLRGALLRCAGIKCHDVFSHV